MVTAMPAGLLLSTLLIGATSVMSCVMLMNESVPALAKSMQFCRLAVSLALQATTAVGVPAQANRQARAMGRSAGRCACRARRARFEEVAGKAVREKEAGMLCTSKSW